MKIGSKEFTPIVNNRVIWNIEEAFGDKPIAKIMVQVDTFTMKQLGLLIYQTIKHEIEFEEFADSIEITQYEEAAVEVGTALQKAFETGSKKK